MDYYVSSTGSDHSTGLMTSPWQTINHALSSVVPNQGDIIHIQSGQYSVGSNALIPTGTSIIGDGDQKPIINGTFVIKNTKNVLIQNLDFNGENYTDDGAINIRDAENLIIKSLSFEKYENYAINMQRVSKSEVSNLDIADCSFNHRIAGGGGQQSSTVSIGDLSDVSIHDVNIDTRARGGQGFSSSNDHWDANAPWSSPPSYLKNVKFYNLDIKVDDWNAWGNGWTPQMAMELWHQTCENVDIFNSTFNSTVSLVKVTDYPVAAKIHVHNNRWVADPGKPFYALEVSHNNIEIDHNYISGGSYPFANFGNPISNLVIHDNIIEGTGQSTLVGNFLTKINGLKFINNTVNVSSSSGNLFYFGSGEGENDEIENNIFYSSVGDRGDILNASVGVSNNLFYHITPEGSGAISADPLFTKSLSGSTRYYTLAQGSAAISSGLYINGINHRYTRTAPDIGAMQTGQQPWKVGKNAVFS